jgi:hypothetical protein
MLLSNIPNRVPEAITQLEAAQQMSPNAELRRTIDRLRAVHHVEGVQESR